jgi:hypothetical protein
MEAEALTAGAQAVSGINTWQSLCAMALFMLWAGLKEFRDARKMKSIHDDRKETKQLRDEKIKRLFDKSDVAENDIIKLKSDLSDTKNVLNNINSVIVELKNLKQEIINIQFEIRELVIMQKLLVDSRKKTNEN